MVDETLNPEVSEEETVEAPEESTEADQAQAEPETVEEPVEESAEAQEIASLKEQLSQAEKINTELKDRMLRVQADFENFRKRTQREKEDLAQYTKENFVTKLLPVLDNLDLALANSSTDNMEAYRKGVELVAKQLFDVLEAEGLKEVEAQDQDFNPNFHHGVAVDQNPEVEDQKITEVFQKGYQLKDKVLRPAMVKVNQN